MCKSSIARQRDFFRFDKGHLEKVEIGVFLFYAESLDSLVMFLFRGELGRLFTPD